MDWYRELAQQFSSGRIPDALYVAIAQTLGENFKGQIAYLVRERGNQAKILFVGADDSAYVVAFAEPTTDVHFIGSLGGGTYRESFEAGTRRIRATFEHPRLSNNEPLEFAFPATSEDWEPTPPKDAENQRARVVRQKLREWAAAPAATS